MIVNGVRRGSLWTRGAALGAAALLVGLACEAPAPTTVRSGDAQAAAPTNAQVAKKLLDAANGARATEARGPQPDMTVSAQRIEIRPAGSMPDSLRPLVLVDGQVGDLSKIDPSSIESISVYKGDKATEGWGARGANGVISITLKKVSEGGGK